MKAERETVEETEIKPRIKLRYHTKSYKMRILHAYDNCTKAGEKGELLRKEGLYTSSITDWRRQLLRDSRDQKVRHYLELENQRLQKELEISRKVIEVQKKILEISELGIKEQ